MRNSTINNRIQKQSESSTLGVLSLDTPCGKRETPADVGEAIRSVEGADPIDISNCRIGVRG